MKKINLLAFIGIAVLAFTSCGNEPSNPIPDSFPKKHLIEEFTGQDCGYCPYGMDCIHDFVGNDSNWIIVLHHYGYKADNFSVVGSRTITNTLKVSGAPSMTIDRAKTKYGTQSAVVFHPGYLENTAKSQFETTTYASIEIANNYDAASRTLQVKVSGDLAKKDIPNLYLTVLVKESGMIDYQSDYYNTYEGWKEFRHTNAVRAYLTEPKGDEIFVSKNHYSATYTLDLNEKWVPENCMVVAFLSEDFQPVVQAEQKPVVAGSKGGADIQHGGVTPVPVADYYPEPNATDGPSTYSGAEADTLTTSYSFYTPYESLGFNFWQIQTYNATNVIKVNKTNCIPFAQIYLFTDLNQTAIPTGTYELNTSESVGSAYAGFRNDEKQIIGGCQFYYTDKSYFDEGYLAPEAQWLIVDGTLTITEEGWELVGHARNGADIHLVGSTPIKNQGKASAPKKAPKRDKFAPHAIEYCK